nr:MAG TPA: hypothetical protein [Caudoviricetes sp.]
MMICPVAKAAGRSFLRKKVLREIAPLLLD